VAKTLAEPALLLGEPLCPDPDVDRDLRAVARRLTPMKRPRILLPVRKAVVEDDGRVGGGRHLQPVSCDGVDGLSRLVGSTIGANLSCTDS